MTLEWTPPRLINLSSAAESEGKVIIGPNEVQYGSGTWGGNSPS